MDKNKYLRNQMDKNSYRRNQRFYERWERGDILTHQELKWADAYYRKRYLRRRACIKYNHAQILQTPHKLTHIRAIPEPSNVQQSQAISEEPCEELHWGDTYDPDGILKEEDSTLRATQFMEWVI